MSMTKVICFANNKGGSGKSTTCSNVGYAMSAMGKKVLMIDGDMQMNLTLSFFDEETALEYAKNGKNLYTAMREQKDLYDFIVPTEYEGLDIIPSSTLMSSIEFELFTKWQREFILRQGLTKIMGASDYLIVPVEASPWGLFGLANMFEFYEQVKNIAPKLNLMGIAVTKASERKNYFRQTMETLGELENVRLFENYIRVDSTVEWAQDNSKPVCAYKKSSRAAGEYTKLTEEVLKYANR